MIKKAFGDDLVSEAQIKLWYWCFKDAWESVESDPHSGRPSTRTPENVERVRVAINENQWLTVRELKEALGIPWTIVSEILMEDLDKKRVVAKFVLWPLLQEKKELRAEVAQDLLETANKDPHFPK